VAACILAKTRSASSAARSYHDTLLASWRSRICGSSAASVSATWAKAGRYLGPFAIDNLGDGADPAVVTRAAGAHLGRGGAAQPDDGDDGATARVTHTQGLRSNVGSLLDHVWLTAPSGAVGLI